jgi:DNA-binding LacI/PurR family transcriptional regulator
MPHVLIAVSTVDQPNHEIGEISFNLVSKQITFHKLNALHTMNDII